MPLEDDEKREVAEMIDFRIDRHHQNVALPMHRENLNVQNAFRTEFSAGMAAVSALSKRIDEWFAELRGRDLQKKEQLEEREKEENASARKREQATAKSVKLSGWTLAIVSIVSTILLGLGIWVTWIIATRPANHPIVVGHDPSIHQEN